MASRIRCVFYDVAANSGCSLHLCTYDCGSSECDICKFHVIPNMGVCTTSWRCNAFQSVLELFTAAVFHSSEVWSNATDVHLIKINCRHICITVDCL